MDVASATFLDAIKDWLLLTADPRLVKHPDGSMTITDLFGASADFCGYMAAKCEVQEERNASQT